MGAAILTILAALGVEIGCLVCWSVEWLVGMAEEACECWLMRED